MKYTLFWLMLISAVAHAQKGNFPFELERHKNSAYTVETVVQDAGAEDHLHAYHTAYKAERAKKPSEYFPEPSDEQKELGELFKEKFPAHPGNSLITFLEDGCEQKNLEALIAHKAETAVLLPYQFAAAFALNEAEKEKTYLQAMLREGMLSDVLKQWGTGALLSAAGYESVMTNGLQDLLAVRCAQLMSEMEPDIQVANKFVQKCGLSEEASAFGNMWFAPTLEKNVIGPFSARLKLVGIGFAFQVPADGDRLALVAKKIGSSRSQTPADRGLVSSYEYLQKALAEAGNQKEAGELKTYIEKEGL